MLNSSVSMSTPEGVPDAMTSHFARAAGLTLVVALVASALSGTTVSAHAACARPDMPGGEWRRMGNTLANSRSQPEERLITPLTAAQLAPAWTFDANRWTFGENNEVTGYPIVADGCVYVGSSTGFDQPGWVFAINADNGDLVWRTRVGGGVFSTLEVSDGRIYAFVSKISQPYVVALDQHTGEILWEKTVDHQIGSDAVSSPIVFDGLVWVGVSGTAAEGDDADRFNFQGNFVLLDADSGEILTKTYTIPDELWPDGYAGGAIWGTVAIDPETAYGYAPTGNPFEYDSEHEHTNAILKLDLARARDAEGRWTPSAEEITNPSFGQIVDSYKGDVEEYFPELEAINEGCEEFEELESVFAFGFECGNLDLDFGATPTIFFDDAGRKLVGAGQKSGVYHAFDAETMEPVYKTLLGIPGPFGGIVGSPAYDGRNIYGPHTVGGYLWSIEKNQGDLRWVAPVPDAVHWGNPVTEANGVIYTPDLRGFLNAFDAQTGAQLLAYPIPLGSQTNTDPALTWGGATVARNTVYVSVGVGLTSVGMGSMPNGFVVAFRPLQL